MYHTAGRAPEVKKLYRIRYTEYGNVNTPLKDYFAPELHNLSKGAALPRQQEP